MQLIKKIIGIFLLASLFFSCGQQNNTIPEGQFAWQNFSKDKQELWHEWNYSEERHWGAFPKGLKP